jgi:D-arabinose 5-phosphate isomerase GutQ
MPPVFTQLLAERLQAKAALKVVEAVPGEPLSPGKVWLAPGNFHMEVEQETRGVRVRTHQGPPENSCRPSADVLFRSVAQEAGYNAIGVLLTGMGKAGMIAKKIAGTFSSTGTPAAFLHPGEAAHGDLGLLDAGDVVLAFSTSGKTREVIEMLELAHHFGIARAIGITSHPDSAIRRLCSIVINMGLITEPCPLGLTPSASTAAGCWTAGAWVLSPTGTRCAVCAAKWPACTRPT